MDTCSAIIMYCQRIFFCLLVNNIVYINFFGGPTCNEYLSSCKFQVWWCYGFGSTALQQEKAEEGEGGEDDKNMKKHISCTTVLCNIYL